MTKFQQHVATWSKCTLCKLCEGRSKVVLVRGVLPSDVLFVGEAPGECITGDSLIDTAFRDKREYPDGVPIKDLVGKSGFKVYSFDTETNALALGTVKKVWKTGYQRVYKVIYSWWGAPRNGKGGREKYYKSIEVTANHPFLLKNGEYKSIQQGLAPNDRLQPFYRYVSGRRYRVGIHSSNMRKEAVFLLEDKIGRAIEEKEQAHHHDRNPENDSFENLELLDIVEHARLHGFEDNAMFNDVHRETHKEAMSSPEYRKRQSELMRNHLATPEGRRKRLEQIQNQRKQTSETVRQKFATDPVYYYNYLKGRRLRGGIGYTEQQIKTKFLNKFPNETYPPSAANHTIESITPGLIRPVYDMEVEKYHNFAVNGIFVHNSENVIGRPFVGPAGKLLDTIIYDAIGDRYRYALTNLVACIPYDETGNKAGEPDKEAIQACAPRLGEIVRIAKPKLIVRVGALAKKWVTGSPGAAGYELIFGNVHKVVVDWVPTVRFADVVHPAAIIRQNVAMQGLSIQKAVVTISNAVEEFL